MPASTSQPNSAASARARVFESINGVLSKFSHIAMALGVAAIMTTLIVRIEPWMMDVLLATNIVISAMVMLVALYVSDSAKLTAFPTVLLVTTLFRLALNVSSTRLILLDADAGRIINAFGTFAVGGNYVVGAVVFVLLVVIQLVVITRGAERVAEVGARFVLDAMPGKQMSIDADLRGGLISAEEARRRRLGLERESRLYGAMDGAMKFVKGDAIACVVISVVNIIAGMIIGTMQMGMTARESAEVFTLLTIGEGLVCQIPALLISFAAGLAVTRVASATDGTDGAEACARPVASDILDQMLAHPWAIAAASVTALGLGLLNGFPTAIFFALSVIVAALAALAFHRESLATLTRSAGASGIAARTALPAVVRLHPDMAVHVCTRGQSGELIPSQKLVKELDGIRARLTDAMGIEYPPIEVTIDTDDRPAAPECGYAIVLYETPLARGAVPRDRVIAITSSAEAVDKSLDAVPYLAPWGRSEFAAIPRSQSQAAQAAGYRVYPPEELLLMHVQICLRRHAAELLGVQEAEVLIDGLRRQRPRLFESVYPQMFSAVEITEILQRLLREEVPVRDLRQVFESLAHWKGADRNITAVTESVRKDLRGVISRRFATAGMVIEYYAPESDFQRQLAEWVRSTAPDQPIALTADQRRMIYDAVSASIDPARHWTYDPVVVVPPTLRKPLRTLLADAFPELAVLATDEIAASYFHRCIGRVRLTREA